MPLRFLLLLPLLLGQFVHGQTIRINDGGQPRDFEAAPADNAPALGTKHIYLYEANKPKTPAHRRELTSQILVHLKPGASPAAISAAAKAHSVKNAATATNLFLFAAENSEMTLALVERIRALSDVISAEPILARQRTKKIVPNDPLFPAQWEFHNGGENGARFGIDLNLNNAWLNYSGKDTVIAIVDDGLELTHPDLASHINSTLGYDWNDGDNDPSALAANGDFHGTLCAGTAAAVGHNGQGVIGVAYEATIAALRLIAGESSDITEAAATLHKNQDIHIKSNSWGPADDAQTLEGPGPLTLAALEEGVRTGRGGRGTIFVWPGGNGLDTGDNVNYDGFANSIYTIAVTGVSDQGLQTDYGEPGACLILAVPCGSLDRQMIATTDLLGAEGMNRSGEPGDFADLNYTRSFSGTSAAVPLAAGSIALMLQANPQLGWRDVQEILMRSAREVDERDLDWDRNSAGLHFNHKFGAGLIDVDGAVALTTNWINLPAQTSVVNSLANLNTAIPDNDEDGITKTFDLRLSSLRVEHVTVTARIRHTSRGNLAVTLISPSGLESRLAEKHIDPGVDYIDWKFMSVRHWGETSQGIWKVKIADLEVEEIGTIETLRLEVFGTETGRANPLLTIGTSFTDTQGGNDNGKIEPGETIAATITFEPVAGAVIPGNARLVSRTPGVVIVQDSSALVGNSILLSNAVPFIYSLSESLPCRETLLFDVITESAGNFWTNSVREKIGDTRAVWLIQTVDAPPAVGLYTSLAIEANGRVHISYYDTTRTALKHAWQTATGWTNEFVDRSASVGTYSSLALTKNGQPRIAYRDATARDLKYAAWNGIAWEIETVHSEGNSGSYSSLALDTNDTPHIAFQDETNGHLLYAKKSGSQWIFQPVDTEATTGANISIALNASGQPRIAYRDVTRRTLRYAEWDGAIWRNETVDANGSVGFDTSIQIGGDGHPRISYRDTTNSDLKYAARSAAGWEVETVDSAGAVGFNTSLALDRLGRPHISYSDLGNIDLKYAAWNGSVWEIQPVDVDGSVGAYSSIALDEADHPRISYRDITRGSLKFASLDDNSCQIFQAPRPNLAVSLSQNEIILTWPSTSSAFAVESTTDLTNPNWSPVTGQTTEDAGMLRLNLARPGVAHFYRLRK